MNNPTPTRIAIRATLPPAHPTLTDRVPVRSVNAVKMRAILSLVLVPALVAGAGCGGRASGEGDPDRIDVVASFYPLAEAAARTGGPAVEVTDLTPPGTEPHDLELGPDDLEAIASADLVVYLGGGFQPAIEDAVDGEASGRAVDVLDGLDLLPDAEGALPADPHVWLDPTIYASIVGRVGAALADASPDDAGAIGRQTDVFLAELEDLDRSFREGLAECERRLVVTSHAAFGYLAAAYDLRQEAIAGVSPESEPDPARLAELAELASEEGVTTIFTEDLVSPEVAEALAADAGLSTAVLSPLEGLTDEQLAAGEGYVTTMRRNLDGLRGGLGCA